MIKKDPIIITGMHRSGTSLLSKILIANDIYMGSKLDSNNESVFFQRINKWIFSCVGSSWDNPNSLKELNSNDINIIINRLNKVLNSRFTKTLYFGKSDLFKNKSFNKIDSSWGWKDPSNSFTLFIWKKIFPNAKVVNIVRHPLDVSLSLLNRENKLRIKDKHSMFPDFLSSILPILSVSKGDVLSSFNISTIDDGLILYKKYQNELNSNTKSYKSNIYNIRYEDLVTDPKTIVKSLFKYLDIDMNNQKLTSLYKKMNTNRIYAYKKEKINFNKSLLEDIDY